MSSAPSRGSWRHTCGPAGTGRWGAPRGAPVMRRGGCAGPAAWARALPRAGGGGGHGRLSKTLSIASEAVWRPIKRNIYNVNRFEIGTLLVCVSQSRVSWWAAAVKGGQEDPWEQVWMRKWEVWACWWATWCGAGSAAAERRAQVPLAVGAAGLSGFVGLSPGLLRVPV